MRDGRPTRAPGAEPGGRRGERMDAGWSRVCPMSPVRSLPPNPLHSALLARAPWAPGRAGGASFVSALPRDEACRGHSAAAVLRIPTPSKHTRMVRHDGAAEEGPEPPAAARTPSTGTPCRGVWRLGCHPSCARSLTSPLEKSSPHPGFGWRGPLRVGSCPASLLPFLAGPHLSPEGRHSVSLVRTQRAHARTHARRHARLPRTFHPLWLPPFLT